MSIKISVYHTAAEAGKKAGEEVAGLLCQAIKEQGSARLVLSTGMSQFDTIAALIQENVPWEKVEMFHLDEYVGLSSNHKASFRKYLQERFVSKVSLKQAYFVSGEGDVEANIRELTKELRRCPVDVGVIGIGENAHIAFNDPPADYDTEEAFKVVDLDERCKQQQVNEGWFSSLEEVPCQAITMTVKQILSCRHIVSSVPYAAKAEAVVRTLTETVNPNTPASILKTHSDWQLYLDGESASKVFPGC